MMRSTLTFDNFYTSDETTRIQWFKPKQAEMPIFLLIKLNF